MKQKSKLTKKDKLEKLKKKVSLSGTKKLTFPNRKKRG